MNSRADSEKDRVWGVAYEISQVFYSQQFTNRREQFFVMIDY